MGRPKRKTRLHMTYFDYPDCLWWNGRIWATTRQMEEAGWKGRCSSHRTFRTVAQMKRAMACAPKGTWVAEAIYRNKGMWVTKTWTARPEKGDEE